MNIPVSLGALFVLSAVRAWGTPIVPTFVKAEIPPNSTTVSLPYFMNGTTDIVFLKFSIPNVSQIVSINSFVIDFRVFDDGDGGGESADFEFAQPATNLVLGGFLGLNGTTAGSPATFSYSLCPCEISQIMPSLADGNFRLRIQRFSGDFNLAGGSALLDVTYAPEPASMAYVGAGLLCLGVLRSRLSRRVYRR